MHHVAVCIYPFALHLVVSLQRIYSYQYIKILVVCPCVCVTDVGVAVTNLRVVCKNITCVSAFTEMAILIFLEIAREINSCCRSGHSALQATRRVPLWALAIALATGKNTGLFSVLDQNETQFFTYVSQRAENKAATVATSD